MNQIKCLFIIVLLYSSASRAEEITSYPIRTAGGVKITARLITADFQPVLQHMEAPTPGGAAYAAFLQRQKQALATLSSSCSFKTQQVHTYADLPLALAGFEGNSYDGSVPTDNDVAISNGNMLVSVANSSIYMFDLNQDSLVKKISLEAFADTLGLIANMYDPRVVYDPKQDRFIMVWLNGSSSDNTAIVVCFSATNDPTGEWFLYALPGDPLQDSSWTDYPQIAITDEELFITANLLQNKLPNDTRPDAWKYYFRQSVIWQISKAEGYQGDSLKTLLHSGIQYQGEPIRYLSPIQGGATTYGPNIYFLSNRPFDVNNDTFFIVEITGRLHDVSSQLIIDVLRSPLHYGVPPDALQRNNHFLLTNDARILDGYLENNRIHFVMNCVYDDTLRAAMFHGIIDDISGSRIMRAAIIGDRHMDYGYPNLSYTGKYPGDDEAIISFNHTSEDSLAGVSAIFYDGSSQQYSARLSLKTGDSFINVLPGNKERWGDYSGSQRKYNEPGVVWIAGFFGSRRRLGGPVYSYGNYTWIAALQSPDTSYMAGLPPAKRRFAVNTFPNPTSDICRIEFEMSEPALITIALYDEEGKKIKTLIHDIAKKGKNIFSFSTAPLSSGIYRVVISKADGQMSAVTLIKSAH